MAQIGKQDKSSGQTGPPPHQTDIVLDYSKQGKKRKKKRGSSRTARRLEDIEKRVSKSARRVSKAVNKGVGTYIDKRDKSARKRRDGALVDFYENAAKGVAKGVSRSTPVLTDLAKAANTKRLRKQVRRVLRRTPVLG